MSKLIGGADNKSLKSIFGVEQVVDGIKIKRLLNGRGPGEHPLSLEGDRDSARKVIFNPCNPVPRIASSIRPE